MALLTVTLAVLIAPNVFAMNRGKVLQNIALWLAIMLALALVYQNFGPGKNQPMSFVESAEKNGLEEKASDNPVYIPPRE